MSKRGNKRTGKGVRKKGKRKSGGENRKGMLKKQKRGNYDER